MEWIVGTVNNFQTKNKQFRSIKRFHSYSSINCRLYSFQPNYVEIINDKANPIPNLNSLVKKIELVV